jgi:hypothetical protein
MYGGLVRNALRRRMSTRRVIACTVALAAVAAFGASVGTPSSNAGGRSAHRSAVTCTHRVTVEFIVYTWFDEPQSNGCWGYNRLVQNTSTFMICKYDGSLHGTGYNRVYDDTNPNNDYDQESYMINWCGTYGGAYGLWEYMAARDSSWCADHGHSSPCWRRNDGGVYPRYFAELYTPYNRKDLLDEWQATGHGANPANSWPVVNFGPDLGVSLSNLSSDVTTACNLVADGGFTSLYNGLQQPTWEEEQTINNALDACTT